jgi:hypothetical protein
MKTVVPARVGLIDRRAQSLARCFGASDRSAQARSKAKPDEVVQTPVVKVKRSSCEPCNKCFGSARG